MKKTLRNWFAALLLAAPMSMAVAAGGGHYPKVEIDLGDEVGLQRGAQIFTNYCLSCHSASSMRFNRLQDIGLSEQEIKDNLLFTTDKIGETMIAAIDPKQAKSWFGANPPDLTVIARSRAGSGGSGADYLYTFLRTFYRDETKVTGWNNLAFPNVGMPHVMWELQGQRRAVFEGDHFKGWEQITPGTLSEQEYDQQVGDLVNYLQWMGEPAQAARKNIGIGVLIFLGIFIVIAWKLNAAFWKDVK